MTIIIRLRLLTFYLIIDKFNCFWDINVNNYDNY